MNERIRGKGMVGIVIIVVFLQHSIVVKMQH